jgi:hypothetical protein
MEVLGLVVVQGRSVVESLESRVQVDIGSDIAGVVVQVVGHVNRHDFPFGAEDLGDCI